MLKVCELIAKLEAFPLEADVYLQDAGDPVMGSELTGCMGYGLGEAEDVRAIMEGVMITTF